MLSLEPVRRKPGSHTKRADMNRSGWLLLWRGCSVAGNISTVTRVTTEHLHLWWLCERSLLILRASKSRCHFYCHFRNKINWPKITQLERKCASDPKACWFSTTSVKPELSHQSVIKLKAGTRPLHCCLNRKETRTAEISYLSN